MREGDGSGPQGDAVGQAVHQLTEEVRLVRVGEDRSGVQDGPLSPGLSQAVLVQRELPGRGVERAVLVVRRVHLTGAPSNADISRYPTSDSRSSGQLLLIRTGFTFYAFAHDEANRLIRRTDLEL